MLERFESFSASSTEAGKLITNSDDGAFISGQQGHTAGVAEVAAAIRVGENVRIGTDNILPLKREPSPRNELPEAKKVAFSDPRALTLPEEDDFPSSLGSSSNADLTTTAGQAAANPQFTIKQCRAAAKREYNRQNAARARERNKRMVAGLKDKCAALQARVEDLTREKGILKSKLEFFEQYYDSQQQQQKQQQQQSIPRELTPDESPKVTRQTTQWDGLATPPVANRLLIALCCVASRAWKNVVETALSPEFRGRSVVL